MCKSVQLIRFRTYAIALTSDIEKAFHQVSAHAKDREFLRFLWFDNVFSDQPKFVCNGFARVIFDAIWSPFLLNKAIRKHAKTYEFDIDFVNKILDCFYVADITGWESDSTKLLTCLRN